jgi:hypothetical protein
VKQVAELSGHDLGAFHPELEGALVGDRVEQPGRADGPVRLAMGVRVPLLIDVTSGEGGRRDFSDSQDLLFSHSLRVTVKLLKVN